MLYNHHWVHQLLLCSSQNPKTFSLPCSHYPPLLSPRHSCFISFPSDFWTDRLRCFIYTRDTPRTYFWPSPFSMFPSSWEDRDWFVFPWPGRGGRSTCWVYVACTPTGESAWWCTRVLQHTRVETWKSVGQWGRRDGLHVTPFQQCSLQEKITKHQSPVPPDFSISNHALHSFPVCPRDSWLWLCGEVAASHPGFCDCIPISLHREKLQQAWALYPVLPGVTHACWNCVSSEEGCWDFIWMLEVSSGIHSSSWLEVKAPETRHLSER